MKFNRKDLDPVELNKKCKDESYGIFHNARLRNGRSQEEIFEASMYGVAAERYLVEYEGFTPDNRKFKDVIDPDGNPVEVKVTRAETFVSYVLSRANKAAKEAWRKYPKLLYIFIGDHATQDYYLYGVYEHNGKRFERNYSK